MGMKVKIACPICHKMMSGSGFTVRTHIVFAHDMRPSDASEYLEGLNLHSLIPSEILAQRQKGLTYQKIADRYGVTRQRVHQIVKGSKENAVEVKDANQEGTEGPERSLSEILSKFRE